MSRKISIQEKKKWLEMYERGETEVQIARSLKRDPRTVTRGIEEAIKNRRLAYAEDDILRNALLKHQEQLTNLLKGIDSMLAIPPYNLELREDKNGILAPIQLSGALVKQISGEQLIVEITNEYSLVWELLQEHLKQDQIWDSIRKWKSTLIDYIRAIWQFKHGIKAKLEEATGLKFVKRQDASVSDYLLPEGVDLTYEVKIKEILNIPDKTDLENNLIAGDDSFVRHGSGGLKYAHDSNTTECLDKIVSVLTSLLKTPEAYKVRITHERLAEITKRANREAKEIELLNMVPGKCRVCRRLGR